MSEDVLLAILPVTSVGSSACGRRRRAARALRCTLRVVTLPVKEAKTPSAAVAGQPLKHAIENRQPPRDDRREREYDDAYNRPACWFRRSVVSVVPRDWDVIVDSAATDKGLNGRDDTAATVALRKMAEHHCSHGVARTRTLFLDNSDLFVCAAQRAAAADVTSLRHQVIRTPWTCGCRRAPQPR
jgi:hypothetical protein